MDGQAFDIDQQPADPGSSGRARSLISVADQDEPVPLMTPGYRNVADAALQMLDRKVPELVGQRRQHLQQRLARRLTELAHPGIERVTIKKQVAPQDVFAGENRRNCSPLPVRHHADRMIGLLARAARNASRAVMPCSRPVAMTLAAAA